MAKINEFEEIIAWQKAIELSTSIYAVTNKKIFRNDFALRDQIRKSVISISSNIAEGFERESNNQFIYFLVIAKGSSGETRSQLYIAKNLEYINEEEFKELHTKCKEVSKLISRFTTYLRENKKSKIKK